MNKNPETQLPAGYIKVQIERIKDVEGPDLTNYKKESEKISAIVLDDLFFELFGITLLQPAIEYEKQWVVKHEVQKPKPKARYNEIGEKHRFKSYVETEEEKIQMFKE